MDWFTLLGVPFARPPQRVPLGGLGGIAGPGETGAVSELGVAGAAKAKSGRHWTFDVIPLFIHYFSENSSLNLRSLPTNCADQTSTPLFPFGSAPSKHRNSIHGIRGIPQARELEEIGNRGQCSFSFSNSTRRRADKGKAPPLANHSAARLLPIA